MGILILVMAFFVFAVVFKGIDSPEPRRKTESGYIQIYTNQGYVYEHRYIAEKILGRSLDWGEIVHHINGKRADNRCENLCVLDEDNHHSYHEWYDWIHEYYGVYPRRETQLRKLRNDIDGIILSEAATGSSEKELAVR